jgi:serine/threonine-protein kinase
VSSERSPKFGADEGLAEAPSGVEPAVASVPPPAQEQLPEPERALQPTEAAPPNEPAEWKDRVLDDRYRVLRLLGEGGMGAVFVAEHLTLHKPVALKVVRAELAGNGEVAARFAREAMATAQFEHPHVASAIDYGTLPEGGAYFVMQLVRGRSLRALLGAQQKKGLPWRRVCEIAAQVADALSAAKSAGIIHRDLKPDNVLVERREDGSDLVKVLDFGIAHVAPRDSMAPKGASVHRELTRVGTVMGTPGYMSPEQAVGDKVDHRTDLYALGVVIWECIAGRELWDGPDLTTVVTRQMTENVPRLREVVQDITFSAELDDLVQRLTARNAADRPEHAAEVRDALRRLAHVSNPRWPVPAAVMELATPVLSTLRPRVVRAVAAYRAQPPAVRWGLIGVTLAIVLGPMAFSTPQPAPAPAVNGAAAPAAAAGASAPAPTAAKPAEPSVIERVVQAVTPAPAATAAPKSKAEPQLPAELVEPAATLVRNKVVLRERRAAALKILKYKPEDKVPSSLRTIAELEIARSCKARKASIAVMALARDPHYLPTLRRYDRSPHSGCGFLSLSDCYDCIRGDVREALDAIERANPGALPDPDDEGTR